MLEIICRYFLTFIFISFLGWCAEELFAIVIAKEKVNRGFLIGPICPIYGFASIIMIILLNNFKDDLLLLFILSIVICAVFEYITAYVLEKFLNIKLWEYKNEDFKYNLHGRVALETLIPFGILGLIIIRYVNPFISSILDKMNVSGMYTLAIIICIIGIVDLAITLKVVLTMDKTLDDDITQKKNANVKKQLDETKGNVKTTIKKTNDYAKKQIEKTNETVKTTIKKTNDIVKKTIKKK